MPDDATEGGVKYSARLQLTAELVTSHLGRVPSRVSRVLRVESESSHESLRSVLESSQVTSHRGLESSRVTQSCRVMPESDIIFNIH